MPPKPLTNKEAILRAAISIVREQGMEGINARSIASVLNRSTKPLFRVYENMGKSIKDILDADWNQLSILNAKEITGLSLENARNLFRDVWLYSHGIATQIVSDDIDLPYEEVITLIKNAFHRFALVIEDKEHK